MCCVHAELRTKLPYHAAPYYRTANYVMFRANVIVGTFMLVGVVLAGSGPITRKLRMNSEHCTSDLSEGEHRSPRQERMLSAMGSWCVCFRCRSACGWGRLCSWLDAHAGKCRWGRGEMVVCRASREFGECLNTRVVPRVRHVVPLATCSTPPLQICLNGPWPFGTNRLAPQGLSQDPWQA